VAPLRGARGREFFTATAACCDANGYQDVAEFRRDCLGAVRYYQIWYRVAANDCTPATDSLSNGYRITWSI